MDIKTVSLKDPDFGKKIVASLHETGFGVLTDHGIDHGLINDVYGTWERFFSLSTDQKNVYKFDSSKNEQSGYFPYKSENAKDSSFKDLKEFFQIYRDASLPLAANQASNRLLFSKLEQLGHSVLKELEEKSPDEAWVNFLYPLHDMIENGPTMLRVIHYPPVPDTEEAGAVRSAAHEDICLITLLVAAKGPGLQVKDNYGNWHAVKADPGSIVLNAGDMLQLASGGYYKSTTHRVVNPSSESTNSSRYSIPMFVHPRNEIKLTNEKTAGQYLAERLQEIGLK